MTLACLIIAALFLEPMIVECRWQNRLMNRWMRMMAYQWSKRLTLNFMRRMEVPDAR